jgi:hypothetical protein
MKEDPYDPFRQALARSMKAIQDRALAPYLGADLKVSELGEDDWYQFAVAGVGIWIRTQRAILTKEWDRAWEILPALGTLDFPRGVPFEDWPREKVIELVTGIVRLALDVSPHVPPFLNRTGIEFEFPEHNNGIPF